MPKSTKLTWVELQDMVNRRIAKSVVSFDYNNGEIKTDLPIDIAGWAEFRRLVRQELGKKFGKKSSWEIYTIWTFERKGDLLIVTGTEEEDDEE